MDYAVRIGINWPREGKDMLVLTRRADQGDHSRIRIGDDIEITVVQVEGGSVRLGVEAPRDLSIDRQEIWAEKKAEALALAMGQEGAV